MSIGAKPQKNQTGNNLLLAEIEVHDRQEKKKKDEAVEEHVLVSA